MRLRWTDPAQTDFNETIAYIQRDNPAAAERVGRRVLVKRSDLESFLEANPIAILSDKNP